MKENGKEVLEMAWGFSHGQMGLNMKVENARNDLVLHT